MTHNENEVMDLLWSEGRALTRSEIIHLSPNKSWKASAIHILLNGLLKNGYIRVEGFTRTGKIFGRVYAAAVTPEQYLAGVLNHQLPKKGQPRNAALMGLFKVIVEGADAEAILELQEILDHLIYTAEQAPEPHE